MGKRILYICTNASAGMRHFSVSILKTVFASELDSFALVMSEPVENNYFDDIPAMYRQRVVFMLSPRGKIARMGTLLFPYSFYREILRTCQRFEIDTIHFLTEDPCVSPVVTRLKKRYTLYYTVHDVITHEIQFRNRLHCLWYNWSHRNRVKKMMLAIDNLVTSSHLQCERLAREFPTKHVYYHPFPSLVTEAIIHGEKTIPELRDRQDYFLFFGRVEKYKGVDILYDVFDKSPRLQKECLVIAGKGRDYFDYHELANVIWMNRFIQDEEVKELFRHAKCVVFPYISATQSGVFSFCFYFNKPVIASDIPFFREFEEVLLFKSLDAIDLERKLIHFLDTYRDVFSGSGIYEQIYGKQHLEESLLKLYP